MHQKSILKFPGYSKFHDKYYKSNTQESLKIKTLVFKNVICLFSIYYDEWFYKHRWKCICTYIYICKCMNALIYKWTLYNSYWYGYYFMSKCGILNSFSASAQKNWLKLWLLVVVTMATIFLQGIKIKSPHLT